MYDLPPMPPGYHWSVVVQIRGFNEPMVSYVHSKGEAEYVKDAIEAKRDGRETRMKRPTAIISYIAPTDFADIITVTIVHTP